MYHDGNVASKMGYKSTGNILSFELTCPYFSGLIWVTLAHIWVDPISGTTLVGSRAVLRAWQNGACHISSEWKSAKC